MKDRGSAAKQLETDSNINLDCLIESSMKDEIDNLASEGLIRLREHGHQEIKHDHKKENEGKEAPSSSSTATSPTTSTTHLFPQDSLHSFRFTSTSSTDLVELRKRVMTRSIDFMKHSVQGWKAPDNLSSHYSTMSLLASMEKKRRNKAKSAGYTRPTRLFDIDYLTTYAPSSPSSSSTTLKKQNRKLRRNSLSDIVEDNSNINDINLHHHHQLSSSSTSSTSTNDTTQSSSTGTTSPAVGNSQSLIDLNEEEKKEQQENDGEENEDEEHDSAVGKNHSLTPQSPSLALFPHPALHNPTRFLPQNQAILTTYGDWKIILSNNIASFVLVGSSSSSGNGIINGRSPSLVGRSVLEYIDESFRARLQAMIDKRRQELAHLEDSAGGMVLVCGNVLPIIKDDGTKSAASLWLKEKRNDTGSSVYIWIFEEVFETVTHVSIDAKGTICYADKGIKGLLDYEPNFLMGKPIDILIPSLAKDDNTWRNINQLKYFGCRTRLGANLPIITKLLDASANEPSSFQQHHHVYQPTSPLSQHYTLRITSIPMIAGLITIRQDGIIDGCNDVFVKYMFGYSQEELVLGKKSISDLIPYLPHILKSLRDDDLLQHGVIINNLICRKLIAELVNDDNNNSNNNNNNNNNNSNGMDFSEQSYYTSSSTSTTTSSSNMNNNQNGRRLTSTPNGQLLPVLTGVHRDGTQFEIQLQLKLVEESDDGVCALWITFDRDTAFSRVGHVMDGPALEIKQHDGLGLPTAKRNDLNAGNQSNSHDLDVDNDVDDDDMRGPANNEQSQQIISTSFINKNNTNNNNNINNSTMITQDKHEHNNNNIISVYNASTTTEHNNINNNNSLPIPIPNNIASTTNSDYSSTSDNRSLSVSRPSCDTKPRVITSFSRPTFTTFTQRQEQASPISPSTPISPSSMTFNRPRAISAASVTMPEYSAQTNAVCIDDFEILDEIGQGAYGLVKLAVLKSDETKKKVVIKYVIKSRILVDCWTRDRKLGMVPAEIHILHTLRKIPHDNCGDMMDYFEDDDYYYIVMELHGAGMDLFDYIELKDTMHESEIKVIFKQIALAVQHLHKHKIVHRDIKDENVVMDHRGGIRLIDYGSAAYIKSGRRYETFVGTLDYAAPEILKGHTYEGPPQDVWALGILLYTLIYRENPFYDIDEIMASELRVPFIFSDGLSVDLVQKMLERDVSKRLSIDEVLEHEWLAS